MPVITTQFPASFEIASINRFNGFSLVGDAYSEFGFSVSDAGDVNADGIPDFIVGAPYANNDGGTAYVLFGSSSLGSNSPLYVTSLNGGNGFAITYSGGTYTTGWSVSGVGDINADGISDLVIGAPDNQLKFSDDSAFVILGSPVIGGTGSIELSTLSYPTGFSVFNSQENFYGYEVGYTVRGIGDVNHDGISDLLVGAPYMSPFNKNLAGGCYVVFGKSGLGSSGKVDLSLLNGANGFAIYGVSAGDQSGTALGSLGDINADGISDFIIGAQNASPKNKTAAGSSYVIFGSAGIGGKGAFNLTSLKGSNGFTIPGVSTGDASGVSLGGIGDINDDGISDFIIGASGASPGARSHAGKSYVVFGKSGIGSSGILDLSTLNGLNGFVINGVSAGDASGFSVNKAGDFNEDGINDLMIGAPSASPGGNGLAGAVYVVFGGTGIGSSGTLELLSLNGKNGFSINGLYPGDKTGWSVSGINDVNRDGISDILMGAYYYNFRYGAGHVIFGDITSQLTINQLTIGRGQTLFVTSSFLNATTTHPNFNSGLIFSISGVQHGYFELVSNPGQATSSFTQQQVYSRQVKFVQDGTGFAPSYNVTVGAGRIATMLPQPATVTFIFQGPALVNNHLTIGQGSKSVITGTELSAIDQDTGVANPNIAFIVSNVQHGYFSLITNPTAPITSFTQGQVQSGAVQFVPDGTTTAPSYDIAVNEGAITTTPQAGSITFKVTPTLENNVLSIQQGQTAVLTSSDLSATDPDDDPTALIFTVSNVQHGYFALTTTPNTPITSFTQGQINSGLVEFISDGGPLAPSYSVSVSDGYSSTTSVASAISFTPSSSPVGGSNNNTVRNAIIGATVSGGIGLFFLGLKLYLTRRAAKSLQKALEGDASDTEKQLATYHKEVIRPIANKVFGLISTSGFLGYRSEQETMAYIAAIEAIVTRLGDLGVDLNLKEMGASKQNALINEIARQTRKHVVKSSSFCSTTTVLLFFKAEATPQQIEEQAGAIAAAVAAVMGISIKHNKSQSGTPVSTITVTGYTSEVVALFADRISARLKTSGICDCCCKNKDEYLDAVESIVKELAALKINLDWSSLSGHQTEQLLNETAHQTALFLKPERSCLTKVGSFFRLVGEFTPPQLQSHAAEIAKVVKVALPGTFVIGEKSPSSSSKTTDSDGVEMSDMKLVAAEG